MLASSVGDPRGPGEVVTGPRMFGVTWGGGGPALPRVHTVQGEHGHLWVTPRPSPGGRHRPLGGDHGPVVTGEHIPRCQLAWGITASLETLSLIPSYNWIIIVNREMNPSRLLSPAARIGLSTGLGRWAGAGWQ